MPKAKLKKKLFNKIAIIGVGLIGGSIGLAARKKKIAAEVIGVCRHQASLSKARRIGAIDKGTLDYKAAVKGAELVILAAPVNQIISTGRGILSVVKRNCLITDVGSTKEEIVEAMERALPKDIYFVGAHPLAGSEKRSVASARLDLFERATCILTKTKKTNKAALKKISTFWKRMGCRIKVLTPQKHDQVVSLISHLPHLAATQLVKVAKDSLDFASSGFFDTTRIAFSDAEIWTDIFLTNKKFVTRAIDRYIRHLRSVRGLIRQGDKKRLAVEFAQIKALRDALQKQK